MTKQKTELEVMLTEVINEVMNIWCPTSAIEEDFQIRMMRALLNVAAYTADARRTMSGLQPIRIDYPILLPNYE